MRHIGTQRLETERLILRPYIMADAEDIFANWATDREASRFWSWEPHADVAVTRSVLAQWVTAYEDPAYYHWAIISRDTMQAIGYIYLDSVNEEEGSAAVHYLLGSAYWRQGLMTEACRRVIAFAFEDVGFRKIRSWHHQDNPASGRVMQKCGMTQAGSEHRTTPQPRLSGVYHCCEIVNE